MMKKIHEKNFGNAVNKLVVVLIVSLLVTIPATAISIDLKSKSVINNQPSIKISADTWVVDDDGTGDYTSIQDAIDNASTGDYIIVKDGTYPDQLNINVPELTIAAASGESPTIYVSSYSVGIDVSAPDVLIEGFEIFGNGSLNGGLSPTIRANTGANGLVVNDNEFKVFTGELGHIALMLVSGVINVSFTSNIVTDYEYTIYHGAYVSDLSLYYGSIQDAINYSSSGSTITVAPGLYNERLVIGKRVNLLGTSGESIVQATDTPSPGVYDVEIDANGTTIRDFIFDFNGPADTRSGNGIVVSDFGEPPVVNVVIQDNIIYTGHTNTGIQTGKYSDVSGLLVSGNIFYADWDGLGEGVYINPYSGDGFVTIDDNEFYGNIFSGISIEASNVTASNNIIDSNTTKGIYGIRFIELTGGENFSGVEIKDNVVHNVTYGIRIGTSTDVGSNLTAEIERNNLTDNDVGVWVRYGANLSNSVVYNSFGNNSLYGINNEGSRMVNAVNNWWGHMSGPYHPVDNPTGLGVNVSDNVTFWPWYEFDGYTDPPTVTYDVGHPQALGGSVITDTTQIEITAEDNESGILSLTYRIWDSTDRWSEWMNYTGKFTLTGDGLKMVQYNATDKSGAKTVGTEIHRVDTTPPYVKTLYPNGGEFVRGNLEIQWEAADKIPDQRQTQWNQSLALSEDYPGHIQSFKPTETSLKSIQLLLYGDDADISVKVFSNLTPVPVPIAQSTRHLQFIGNPNFPVWIDFPLEHEISLDTDETYYIGVTQEVYGNVGFYWYYYNSSMGTDPYPYGQGWLRETDQLVPHPEWDWCFKTMYWENDVDISVEYSPTGAAPWSTIAEDETNDGSYIWNTAPFPDGDNYKIRILAEDYISNIGGDESDNTFTIDNTGPIVSNVIINDTTIGSTEYCKDGDNIKITATIEGNPINITADLSGFGKGTDVPPTSYVGTTAKWIVNAINCAPPDGTINVVVRAEDPTGDTSGNTGSITADNTPPTVEITRPGPGVYFMDSMRLMPFSYPLVIGQITMRAEATDSGSGVQQVEFYIDDKPLANITEPPYEYLWDQAAFGFFTVEVIVKDNVGLTGNDIMRDFFIINFDILGH